MGAVRLRGAGMAFAALALGPVPARPPAAPAAPPAAVRPAARLAVEVISVRPHDPHAFTQGLVWSRGRLYESDGLYSASSLREVDPATGEVRRRLAVPQGFRPEQLQIEAHSVKKDVPPLTQSFLWTVETPP